METVTLYKAMDACRAQDMLAGLGASRWVIILTPSPAIQRGRTLTARTPENRSTRNQADEVALTSPRGVNGYLLRGLDHPRPRGIHH